MTLTIEISNPTEIAQLMHVFSTMNLDLLDAAKPIRTAVTLAQLAQEQGYDKTDWQRLNQLAKDMNIQEPIEELFAQLNA